MTPRQVDHTANKLVEGICVHKHPDHPALLNLPDTYGCIRQLLTGQVKQLILGWKSRIDSRVLPSWLLFSKPQFSITQLTFCRRIGMPRL